uniref:C-type lectin domain-containing protein n=1 Tax=Labrus bergylta TaxID=56723 RepID=A0A3Q3MNW3_9LABR
MNAAGGNLQIYFNSVNLTWTSNGFPSANPPGQRTFVLIQKAMNWTDAREYCRNHHTDLAMMLTEPEARDLGTVKGPHRVWIGMYREPWRWSDNRNSSFKNWRDGQPNNAASAQYCVYHYLDYTWGDDDCTKMHSFCFLSELHV